MAANPARVLVVATVAAGLLAPPPRLSGTTVEAHAEAEPQTWQQYRPHAVRIDDMVIDAPDVVGLPTGRNRAALTNFPRLWSNGRIPVQFDPGFSSEFRTSFFWACDVWSHFAAVSCAPRAGEQNFLWVIKGEDACWAEIGAGVGGARFMNVPEGSCHGQRTLVHEIGHTLGFLHEHQRPDRDTYIAIDWNNIAAGKESNFTVLTARPSGPYDFASVLHYASNAFARTGFLPVLVAKPGFEDAGRLMGATYPSSLDGSSLRGLYGGIARPFVGVEYPYPTNFFGRPSSDGSVVFTWDLPRGPVLPIVSYELEVRWAQVSPSRSYLKVTVPGNATSYAAVLSPGRNDARVTALDTAGFRASASHFVNVPYDGNQDTGHPVLNAVQTTSNPVTIAWSPGLGVDPANYLLDVAPSRGSRISAASKWGARPQPQASHPKAYLYLCACLPARAARLHRTSTPTPSALPWALRARDLHVRRASPAALPREPPRCLGHLPSEPRATSSRRGRFPARRTCTTEVWAPPWGHLPPACRQASKRTFG